MAIQTENVTVPVAGKSMPAYLVTPEGGGARGAVIVWMEIFGVNAHIQDVTERVAKEGYVAIAPNFFHRSAPDLNLGYDEAGMNEGIGHMMKLQADEMIADAQATIDFLGARSDTNGKVGVMGFCIGGHMTYLTACETSVNAAASFYGGGIAGDQGPGGAPSTIGRTAKINCPIVCLFGAKDAHIPLDQVDAVRDALKAQGKDGEVVLYDEADHGFFCDKRESYHKASAADAWTRVKTLFTANLA